MLDLHDFTLVPPAHADKQGVTTATLHHLEPPAGALPTTPQGQPALSLAHLAQLDEARVRRKKIGRALFTAGMSAWTLAIFAALSLPFALFDLKSGVVGVALGFIAYREFAGRHKLKRLAPDAASHLGWNQVLLCGLLVLYSVWQLITTLTGPSTYAEAIATTPELASTLEPIEAMMRLVALAVYASILVVGLFTQGGLALYYFTRQRHIRTYLEQTPAWIVELQRRG